MLFSFVEITSFFSSGTSLVGSESLKITCTATIIQNEVEFLNVSIQDPSDVLASEVYDLPLFEETYSVNYTFNQLGLLDSGTYRCVLISSAGTTQRFTKTINITGNVSLYCSS